MLRFWAWLRSAAGAKLALGEPPLAITEALIRSAEFDPFRDWECPERLLISVAALQRELAGRPPMNVSPVVRARLFRQVAILKARIESDGDAAPDR